MQKACGRTYPGIRHKKKRDKLTFPIAGLEDVVVVIQVLDVGSDAVVFGFCAGFFIRLLCVVIHLDLTLAHTARRSLPVETLTKSLTVLERRTSASSTHTNSDTKAGGRL